MRQGDDLTKTTMESLCVVSLSLSVCVCVCVCVQRPITQDAT